MSRILHPEKMRLESVKTSQKREQKSGPREEEMYTLESARINILIKHERPFHLIKLGDVNRNVDIVMSLN